MSPNSKRCGTIPQPRTIVYTYAERNSHRQCKKCRIFNDSRRPGPLAGRFAQPHRYLKRLAVRAAGKTVFVDVADLDWIEAAENYVKLHAGKTAHLLQVTMSTLESALDPEHFLRVHRSAIVNVERIKELQPLVHGEYAITLAGGARLRSGRTYHDRLAALTANPF